MPKMLLPSTVAVEMSLISLILPAALFERAEKRVARFKMPMEPHYAIFVIPLKGNHTWQHVRIGKASFGWRWFLFR